jgi:nucleotide-binding universal stress UspA family protein/dienelactone hydrolase
MLTVRTILHPTDFSESSEAAFQFACSLARDYGARVVVLHAFEPPTGVEADAYRAAREIDDELATRLHEVRPIDRSVEVEHRLVEGAAADAILRAAEAGKCDLIVMGTRGRSGLRRAILGSVAEKVTRNAACPVMTVRWPLVPPPPAEPPAAPEEVELGVGDPFREVTIEVGEHALGGTLRWAGRPRGVVVFAHGSGSSRHSPRNRHVADALVRAGFATLLMDLLDEDEAQDRGNVFDVELLADRLAAATGWLATQPETAGLPVGYFGASTGSAAALAAAARRPDRVAAVVSRGGRPDLAWEYLPAVAAPTLLIVGGADDHVLALNRDSLERLDCPKALAVVPGASHLFEEPGALDEVARRAADWFARCIPTPAGTRAGSDRAVAAAYREES